MDNIHRCLLLTYLPSGLESTLVYISFVSRSLRLKMYPFSTRIEVPGNERISVASHQVGMANSWGTEGQLLGILYVRCANMAAPKGPR